MTGTVKGAMTSDQTRLRASAWLALALLAALAVFALAALALVWAALGIWLGRAQRKRSPVDRDSAVFRAE